MNRLRHLLHDRSGVASLEAGILIAVLLVPLCGGIADAGLILMSWMRVNRAERAALLYAWGVGANTGGMLTAATTAFGGPAPSVSATAACYCLPSNQTWNRSKAQAVSCGSTCTSGDTLTEFVSITVGTTVALPVPVPFFASSYTVSSTSVGRVL
jgi:Flp pilus assembly protein TadG